MGELSFSGRFLFCHLDFFFRADQSRSRLSALFAVVAGRVSDDQQTPSSADWLAQFFEYLGSVHSNSP